MDPINPTNTNTTHQPESIGHQPVQTSSVQSFGVPVTPAQMHREVPKFHTQTIADKIEQIIVLFYFFIAAIMIFRFVLSMLGANRATLFVDFVYQLTAPFLFPFTNMFGRPVGVSNYRLEFEVIVALLVYALVFFSLARLVRIIFK